MIEYMINEERSLTIMEEAHEKLLNFVQTGGKHERGGVLLGKVTVDYRNVYVTDFSTPSEADRSGRFFFIRNKTPAQKIIDKAWKESKGEVNYIGEWHTHPANYLIPSLDDKTMIYESLYLNDCPFDELFLIIIGTDRSLYVGHRDQQRLKKLKRKE